MNIGVQKFFWLCCLSGFFASDLVFADSCKVSCDDGECVLGTCGPMNNLVLCGTCCRPSCQEKEYNAGTCTLPGTMSVSGYICKKCPEDFPKSEGGSVGIGGCFRSESCQSSWDCRLFHDGVSWCKDQNGNLKNTHIENVGGEFQCAPLSRSCNWFKFADPGLGDNWSQTEQQGNATWNNQLYTWNVDGCYVVGQEEELKNTETNETYCTGVRWHSGYHVVGNAAMGFDGIKYSPEFHFCTRCGGGKKPNIFSTDVSLSNLWCGYYPDYHYVNNEYVACWCEDVEAGFYSTGCNIGEILSLNDIPTECHQTCPDYMTTLEPGAENKNSCRPDGTEFCDQTGCFTLGPSSGQCQ